MMKNHFLRRMILLFSLFLSGGIFAEKIATEDISILWEDAPLSGTISVSYGSLLKMEAIRGKSSVKRGSFAFSKRDPRLTFWLGETQLEVGPKATVVHLASTRGNFSFFVRDVSSVSPIYLPMYNAIVVPASDKRSFAEIKASIEAKALKTKIKQIEDAPEMSFEAAAVEARDMTVPIRLGIGRDIRMFQITEDVEDVYLEDKEIRPLNYAVGIPTPEMNDMHAHYKWSVSRGVGYKKNIKRSLEEGVMPIYHAEQKDDDILYHTVSFVSLESSSLEKDSLLGTHFMIADKYSSGRAFTPDQQAYLAEVEARIKAPEEEMLLCVHTEVRNEGQVPRYAWMRVPRPAAGTYGYDTQTGISSFTSGRAFCRAFLDGKPPRNEEIALLLQPGESASFDFVIPHTPLLEERMKQLLDERSLADRYQESRAYWRALLGRGANVSLPEKRIDEMMKAGLLHLHQVTFGERTDSTLAPAIGVYPPIGTESAPIIQYYLSMGWNEVARRSLNYFLETQQADGRVENFYGYTVETGAALWSIGEYCRYTQDTLWLKSIQPKLLKACRFLLAWRERNKREELRGRGYGLVEGKVADPEDHYHQFMLNGYSSMGLSRMAEVMALLGDPIADSLRVESTAWKADIRRAFFESMERSPVIPLGDGTWSPSTPPWAEAKAPRVLYQDPERFWSHGTFTVPDALLGPVYLVFCEIIDPQEPAAEWLLNYHSELLCQNNSVFSQPYYSRHNWCQVRRGMVNPFLSTYYTTLAAHADRETYFFWEHLFRLTPNKTHEEANFLMDTRWMLYLEEKDTLRIFPAIPRLWLSDGKEVVVKGMQSYFGTLDVAAKSQLNAGKITCSVVCDSDRKPSTLKLRLPHPEKKQPSRVEGGTYDASTETVTIADFTGHSHVVLWYE